MINVVMTTYCPEPGHVRGSYGPIAAKALRKHLVSSENRRLIIANDGPADQPHCGKIAASCPQWQSITVGGPRVGIGGSLNRALNAVADDELWLYTTDDWVLTSRYDLTQAVRLLRETGDYDYVRLGPPHPNVGATIKFQQGLGWWLALHRKEGLAFGTRPFLATKSFYYQVGPFKEQCDAYECEKDYAERLSHLHGPGLAEVVCSSLEGPWQHIGHAEVGDVYP